MTGARAAALAINVLEGAMCVARLPADAPMPDWIAGAGWCSVTRTDDELSIVCEARLVPDGVRRNDGWRMLQVQGPLDFNLTGILFRITAPLANAGISIFALSTFDTDYVLVGERDLREAISHLRAAGIIVRAPD